jgi:hypothetical protein
MKIYTDLQERTLLLVEADQQKYDIRHLKDMT